MAFWPSVVMAILYLPSSDILQYLLVGTAIFSGSLMYIALRQVKNAIQSGRNTAKKKQRVRRDSRSIFQLEVIREATDQVLSIFPGSTIVKTIFSGGILLNAMLFIWYFVKLGRMVASSPELQVTLRILFLLPVVYVFIFISVLIWKVG